MLAKEEYQIAYQKGRKVVLCERIDMIDGIEEELLQGTLFAYKCPAEKDSALTWKAMFEDLTKRSFVCGSSKLVKGPRAVFVARLCCAHRRCYRPLRKSLHSKRDFGCRTILKAHVRHPESPASTNVTRGGYNLRIASNRQAHNHSVEVALRFRRVGASARAELIQLFDEHHTITSAMEALKLRLLDRLGDDYLTEASDRSVLPDKTMVTRLFYETYRERYGDLTRKQVRKLQEEAAARRRREEMGPLRGMPQPPMVTPGGGGVSAAAAATGASPVRRAVTSSAVANAGVSRVITVSSQNTVVSFVNAVPTNSRVNTVTANSAQAEAEAAVSRLLDMSPNKIQHVAVDAVEEAGDDATDDFLDSFEAPGELPIGWIGAPSAPFDISGGGGAAGAVYSVEAAVTRMVDVPAQASEEIVGYIENGEEGTIILEPMTFAVAEEAEEGTGDVTESTEEMMTEEMQFEAADAEKAVPKQKPFADAASIAAIEAAAAVAAAGGRTPSPEELCSAVSSWASALCRQLMADQEGEWRSAAKAFLDNWDLLPAPGQRKALHQFGRAPRLGRPSVTATATTASTAAATTAAATPARPLAALPTENVSTQTGDEGQRRHRPRSAGDGYPPPPPPPPPRQKGFNLCVLRTKPDINNLPPIITQRRVPTVSSIFRTKYDIP